MHSRRPGAESDRLAADESANQNPTDPTLAQPPDSQARAAPDANGISDRTDEGPLTASTQRRQIEDSLWVENWSPNLTTLRGYLRVSMTCKVNSSPCTCIEAHHVRSILGTGLGAILIKSPNCPFNSGNAAPIGSRRNPR
jgi:hypothetical protein